MIRAFVAIDLPAAIQGSLDALQGKLRRIPTPVAWIKAGKIHLTLKFLGNISPEQVPDIQEALQEVAAGSAPFKLQPSGCGAFPSVKQMRVIWVGLRGDLESLKKLRNGIEGALVRLDFEPEDRPFRPHLTLGRITGKAALRQMQEALLAHRDFHLEAFDVAEVVLYKSELRPEGARYTALFRAALAAGSE